MRLAPDLKLLSKLNRSLYQDDQSVKERIDPTSTIEMFGSMDCPCSLTDTKRLVEEGFDKGLKPKLTEDGTSGTYLLRGPDKQPAAVFKPIDEEAFAPNNPRDYVGPFGSQSFRAGVLSGEACIREVCAYLLDHQGFSGVPPTTMVEAIHDSFKHFKFKNVKIITDCNDYVDMITSIIAPPNMEESKQQEKSFMKIGSLQQFMKSDGAIEDYSSDLFEIDEIHKIAILDLRLMNLDRNEGNILVRSHERPDGTLERTLVPIDHGLSIPDTLAVCSYDLVWLSYSQAEKPFSKKSLKYIKNLDIMKDLN